MATLRRKSPAMIFERLPAASLPRISISRGERSSGPRACKLRGVTRGPAIRARSAHSRQDVIPSTSNCSRARCKSARHAGSSPKAPARMASSRSTSARKHAWPARSRSPRAFAKCARAAEACPCSVDYRSTGDGPTELSIPVQHVRIDIFQILPY